MGTILIAAVFALLGVAFVILRVVFEFPPF